MGIAEHNAGLWELINSKPPVKDSFGRDWPFDEMKKCVGEGWWSLIGRFYDLCQDQNIAVAQVKEKFGTLRLYTCGCPAAAQDIIDEIENRSGFTCEVCGATGKTIEKNGWLKTVCPKHHGRVS